MRIDRHKVTNPFYDQVKAGGIHFVGAAEMTAHRRKVTNPYYERVRSHPGRPRGSEGPQKTVTKSVRLPPAIWKRVEAQAKREGKTLHAALRQAVLIWLQS